MDPDEHSRYLQNAVSLWDFVDAKGEIFPKEIPRDAFPSEPDPEMLQWHEGVSRRLEHDYVKRNTHRSSPPNFTNFGAYHTHFSGKDPLADEEDYSAPSPRRTGSRRHTQFQSDRPSWRRHHNRRLSDEHPPFNGRRPEDAFVPRPDGGRSGVPSPRVSSPSGRAERPRRSRDRDRATWYGQPINPGMEDTPDIFDVSDRSHHDEDPEPKYGHHPHNHKLSPPPNSRERRHSHDAYTRKPARDLSPAAPRRRNEIHEARPPKANKSNFDKTHRNGDRARSRTPGVKFREYIFDGPIPAPAPSPPQYTQPSPPPPPPPPRAVPRHLYNNETYTGEDTRRGSYNGASAGGSRPGSGGSGSERPRSYSSAGFHPRSSRWTSPVRSSAAKRYIPTSMAEDAPYIPSPSRRVPLHD